MMARALTRTMLRPTPSDAPMFHWNEQRASIVDEVTRRVTTHRRAAAAASSDESLAYVLNDLVIYEEKRLRHVAPPDTPEDKRRVDALARALMHGADDAELAHLLELQVRAYVEDIAGTFSMPTYRFASRLLPAVLSLLFSPLGLHDGLPRLGEIEARIRVEGDLAQLRRLAERATLVVVPTHLSNLDSPLVGYSLERAGLPPMTYGAGKNLFTSPLTSFFMARLGAYKVDRRLRFDLYKEVLKTFSQVILERGMHSIFFPGGTRSRSGAIERKLKLGLAGTALSAWIERLRREGPTAGRYYFVPLTLNQPLVLEAETLVEDYLREIGKQRYIIEDDEFTRVGRVAQFGRKLLTMESAIEARFCAPRDPFGNPIDGEGRSLDEHGREIDPVAYVRRDGKPDHHKGRDEEYTRELGHHIADDFVAGSSFFPTHLVAHVLNRELERQLPGLDLYRRLRHPREVRLPLAEAAARVDRVRDAIAAHSDRLGHLSLRAVGLTGAELVRDALESFSGYHTRPAALLKGDDVVLGDRELIFYYANRLSHHGPAQQALA
jgi:glycerol-3-phosphate O-acyltransferase